MRVRMILLVSSSLLCMAYRGLHPEIGRCLKTPSASFCMAFHILLDATAVRWC